MCRPIYYVLVLQLATINKTLRVLIKSMALTMIIYDDTINLETKDADVDLRKTKRGQFWSAMLLAIS